MVESAGCDQSKFKSICSSVDKLDKEPWEKVKKELIDMKGLTEEQCDKLWEFVKLKGSPAEMMKILKEDKPFGDNKLANETIAEMELLFKYTDALEATEFISFDFSLARGLDYYTGLIYEAVLLEGNSLGSIAGGGRYDGLVGMFSSTEIPAVGVSIGIERMFTILEQRAIASKSVRASSTQVLVCSIGKDQLVNRMTISNKLRKAGIRAEIVY